MKATAPFTGLTFATNPAAPDNILLDDISVVPVPEAATTVSLGLLLMLGMGGVVIPARKKKAVASA